MKVFVLLSFYKDKLVSLTVYSNELDAYKQAFKFEASKKDTNRSYYVSEHDVID
jgi:hypothetical protein